ncbi:hypothetical protein GCM10007916_11710 [Psychromonas marina]|uniref:Uncharacterized protein n=1 Tax=Psychromonas marina TaxID=88364 RepID=A0ABQ6DY71_9GAMM|nr:hypothetical protein [Psychromonas marina]GLS90104.1 hypothetical protein GCM10007916_11710 [Psychromonas marina]
MGSYAIIFFIDVIITSLCMYVATSLSFVKADLKPLLAIVAIVSVVAMIPTVGWIFGIILFVYLLMKATDADMIDCIWVVAFTKLVTFFALFLLQSLFA